MAIELDALVVSLRADTERFRKEIADAGRALEELKTLAEAPGEALSRSLATALDGNALLRSTTRDLFSELEATLLRFAETGNLSFRGLRDAALGALGDIARQIAGLFGGNAGGGLAGVLLGGIGSLLGFAQGGPASGGRPVVVGEQGPEIFVPRTAGEVLPNRPGLAAASAARPISITVNMNGTGDSEAIRQSGTQVALAVRRALLRAERAS